MVRSKSLTSRAIVNAIDEGEFYATNGVILTLVKSTSRMLKVVINKTGTRKALESPYVMGKKIDKGTPGYLIEFIGYGGMVMQKTMDTSAMYRLSGDEPYIRCRITYQKMDSEGNLVAFYAWTQPVFAR